MVRPLFRKAISCSRRVMVSNENSMVSKIAASAQNVTVVPVCLVGLALCSGAGRLLR